MRPTYIAGYDGSDASRAALRLVTQLADEGDGEVVVAHVHPVAIRSYGKGASDGAVAALDEQARADAAQMLTDAGVPAAMQRVVGAGSPAEGLHRLCESGPTALVAVGVTHRGELGRIIPGSVAEHLLHGAPCPVAVVPAAAAVTPTRTVAVAYDDSREAQAALHAGVALARRSHARLRLVGVAEMGRSFAAHPNLTYAVGEPLGDLEEQVKHRLEEVARALPSDIHAEARVYAGAVAETLLAACADGIDLLVLGSRGYGPSRSVLLGTVSRHVVDHALCPVIVVPRTASADVLADPAPAEERRPLPA